jgi:hypothetical protein
MVRLDVNVNSGRELCDDAVKGAALVDVEEEDDKAMEEEELDSESSRRILSSVSVKTA